MKKFFISMFILALCLSFLIAIILLVYEERIVEKFKSQITDKTDININFSKVRLSLFKNFPYCSFVLNDACILYTSDKHSDTLISSKVISFKINTINLFRSIYEFPEIEFSDGIINIKSEKVELLFSKKNSDESLNSYVIQTERIKIKNCLVKYSSTKNVNLLFHLSNVNGSSTIFSNSFAIRLNFIVDSLNGHYNNFNFKNNIPFSVATIIKKKNDLLFSETGLINLKSISLGFTFNYSFKNNSLITSLSSDNISIKELKRNIQQNPFPFITKGDFSLESHYSLDFNNLSSQKLTIKYELRNLLFQFDKNLSLSNLRGTTTFLNNFEKNISEISNFSADYSGLSFFGSAKIVDFPKPHLLINTKIIKTKDLNINKELVINGSINGEIKLLARLKDIYNLNYNNLNIIKVNSTISLSNLSIDKFDIIKKINGKISLDEKRLTFSGNGKLFTSTFQGNLEITNFLNAILYKKELFPVISFDADRINLDSILLTRGKNESEKYLNAYQLSAKIKKLIYKGIGVNNLSLNLKHSNKKFICDRFSMNVFSGNLTGNFSSSTNGDSKVSILFGDVDINHLFKSFNNFDQQVITSENISGNLSGNADIAYKLGESGIIDPSSIKVSSNLLVENGKLWKLNQFERLSKFLNLEEIESINFNTLENKIIIKNKIVTIPLMKIASNAINFVLAGEHHFSGDFNYWIQVNLKEILTQKILRKNNYFSDYEHDNYNGLNLFFKLTGNSDNFKFTFDKKNSLVRLKDNFKEDGPSFKIIIQNSFKQSKRENWFLDSINSENTNKVDSNSNKNKKSPFRIEWDEIDSTKKF